MTANTAASNLASNHFVLPGHPPPRVSKAGLLTAGCTGFATVYSHFSGLPDSAVFFGIIFAAALASLLLLALLPPTRTWWMWWIAYLPAIAFFLQGWNGTFPITQILCTLMLLYFCVLLTTARMSTGSAEITDDALVVDWNWALRKKQWTIPYADIARVEAVAADEKAYRKLPEPVRPVITVHTREMTFTKKDDRCLGLNIPADDLENFRHCLDRAMS